MYIRAVRFTDATAEQFDRTVARVQEAGGPPPGVKTTGLQLLLDAEQGTAFALQLFDTVEDMREADQVFAAMDQADTPGTRASVDMCEVKLDLRA